MTVGAPWLATELDRIMLGRRGPIHHPLDTKSLPNRSGDEVAEELNGRLLLRYVTDDAVREALDGRIGVPTYVTPTPYAVQDVAAYLALPMPDLARGHVILIDPSGVEQIAGPCQVAAGQGIEYLLPHGYPETAIVGPEWAVKVR